MPLRTAAALVVLTIAPATAHAEPWRHFTDPQLGLSIDVPVDGFEAIPDNGSGAALRLADDDDGALIEVFAGSNRDGRSLKGFSGMMAGADGIAEVTYRANGNTWFVLSGYYQRDGYGPHELIFYSKFMFTPDLSRFSGFEISYPADRKQQFDPVVGRLEDSLHSPP